MRREQPSNPSLELVGLLLLFLTMPELLRGRHVVLRVDNRSVDHAWGNKTVKPDIGASALVRALMIVSALLECQLYVGHTKQYTMAGSYLANCLTRDTTASEAWATVQNVTLKDPLRTCGAGLRTRLPTGSWASS